ncbi:MAG: hypothetical protein ACREOZ_00075, partial [Gloeomargaritales cyanobacterium]
FLLFVSVFHCFVTYTVTLGYCDCITSIEHSFCTHSRSRRWRDRLFGGGATYRCSSISYLPSTSLISSIITVVCDGDKRHHSKRASIERIAAREGARIDSIIMRGELMPVAEELQNGNCSDVEKVEQTAKKDKLVKAVKGAEDRSSAQLLDDFVPKLRHAAESATTCKNEKQVATISFVQAIFQADAMIAYRCIHGDTDIIMSPDSDFAMLGGVHCIAVKTFIYTVRNPVISKIVVASGCKSAIDIIPRSLGISDACIVVPKFPVFDGQSPALRAAIAVGLLCDQFPGGVKGTGPAAIMENLKSHIGKTEEDCLKLLLKLINSKSGIEIEVLQVFIQKILCEPGNTTLDDPALPMKHLLTFATPGRFLFAGVSQRVGFSRDSCCCWIRTSYLLRTHQWCESFIYERRRVFSM